MFNKPASFALFLAAALKLELATNSQSCQAQLQPSFSNGVRFTPNLVDVKTSLTQEQVLGSLSDWFRPFTTPVNSTCDSCANAASSQVTALQRYASVWKSQFASVFQQFSIWVTAIKTACSSLNLQLDVILKGLNLNLNLFLSININLPGLLGVLGGEIELFASPEGSHADGKKNYDLSICLKVGLCTPLPTDIPT
ncbi:hypothetical protein Pst134EB_025045 [Puccinia striiformis f. sp. tritici]|nr:hypothetical protein Pst134EB_025045 [Puccinia striiformis f. sp. tritici]